MTRTNVVTYLYVQCIYLDSISLAMYLVLDRNFNPINWHNRLVTETHLSREHRVLLTDCQPKLILVNFEVD